MADNADVGCQFEELPRSLPIRFAMPFKLSFPYAEAFDYKLGKMFESGVIERLKNRWLYPMDKSKEYVCSSRQNQALKGVQFSKVSDGFLLLSVGAMLGFLIFVSERLLYKKN